MIYSVKGKLIYLDPQTAVVECGGVGFRCQITMNTAREMPPVGEEARLFTYMNVREDAIELFGFADKSEMDCFKQLISISGVGPKAATAILSEMTPDKVALAAATGDYKAFTKAQGVGGKTAQRIVLELKDKVKGFTSEMPIQPGGVASVSGNAEAAVSALTMLGFTAGEASAAVGKLDSSKPVEVLIKEALKSLNSKK